MRHRPVHISVLQHQTDYLALLRSACIEENTTWDLVKYDSAHHTCYYVARYNPTPGTLKGSENISESKSGMCLEAPGYAIA